MFGVSGDEKKRSKVNCDLWSGGDRTLDRTSQLDIELPRHRET